MPDSPLPEQGASELISRTTWFMCIPFPSTLMYYISSNRINIKKQQTCPFKMKYFFFSFQL